MGRHEQQHEAHIALHALVRVDRPEDLAALDHVEDLAVHVGVHDLDLAAEFLRRLRRAQRRIGLRHEQRAEIGIGLRHAEHGIVGLGRILVRRRAGDQLDPRMLLAHPLDEGGDAPVVIVLARVFENAVLALAAQRLGDHVGGIGAFAIIVGGDVGDALAVGRVGCEGHHRHARGDGAVDRLDERIRIHRMDEDAGRLLRQDLVEARDLLGDVVFRRAGIGGLAAERLRCLLEHLVDREPVLHARDHHVHVVGLAFLAAKLRLGLRCRALRQGQRQAEARGNGQCQRPGQFLDAHVSPPVLDAGPISGAVLTSLKFISQTGIYFLTR